MRASRKPGALASTNSLVEPRVLTNALQLVGNPYLTHWNHAVHSSGAVLVPIATKTILARGAAKPHWVHLQWPEWVIDSGSVVAARRMVKLIGLLVIARARGARILVTAHNVWSHDARHPILERILWRCLGLVTTDVHLLCEAGADEFFANHPSLIRARRHVIPLGDYSPAVADVPDRATARAALGLPANARVLLTFGSLKGYKGVGEVLDSFEGLADEQARFIVAGRIAEEPLRARLQAARERDPRIVVIPRFLDQGELTELIRAADHVVLPYQRVLNSASAILALTLGRPVLLPRTPTFEALARRAGEGWVALFDGPLDAARLAALPSKPITPVDLSWCSWDRIERLLTSLWATHPAARSG